MDYRSTLIAPLPANWLARLARPLAVMMALVCTGGLVRADQLPPDCGEFTNSYGPFDYTNPDHFHHKLAIVEKFHFRPEQELSTYKQGSKIKVDFGYTLRAFPNHHRALMALSRWLRLHKPEDWTGEIRPECYFHRAVAWRPRDAVSQMIFGLYLHQNQRYAEAESHYQAALQLNPNYAEAHFNLGLLLADQKRWPESLAQAHQAYALNYPLPGLKNRLLAAKVWQEPATKPVVVNTAEPANPVLNPASESEPPTAQEKPSGGGETPPPAGDANTNTTAPPSATIPTPTPA